MKPLALVLIGMLAGCISASSAREQEAADWQYALHANAGLAIWDCRFAEPTFWIRGDYLTEYCILAHELHHIAQMKRVGCEAWHRLSAAQRDSAEAEARRVSGCG